MNLRISLTIVGLAIGLLGGIISQFWKESTELEGTNRKQLTLPGRISVGVSLIGFIVAVASNVIPEKKEKKQIDLASSLQPLSSLSIRFQYITSDPSLRKVMADGEVEIQENSESVQGGVPRVPYEVMEYEAAILPVLSYIARVGPKAFDDGLDIDDADRPLDNKSMVVLIPLDDSQNTILSFGYLDSETSWYEAKSEKAISYGVITTDFQTIPEWNSIPHVSQAGDAKSSNKSTYVIDWALSPSTLARSIDKANSAVPSIAKMPKMVKVALFFDIGTLPFKKGDFSVNFAIGLWDQEAYGKTEIDISTALSNVELLLTPNGWQDTSYRYMLKRFYRVSIFDQFDDEIGASCAMLEFESS